MSANRPVVVEVEELVMKYGNKTAVGGVSFSVRQGEVLAILGPNGAGKTSIMETLEGFRIPTSGNVRVLGTEPWRGSEGWRARIGIVLQAWQDHPRWTARRLLRHCSRYFPVDGSGAVNVHLVEELEKLLDLGRFMDRPLGKLSGGERRRVDVALALMGSPEVIFMDEPTTGLDPRARRQFHDLTRLLARERGISVLLTTHDLDEVDRLADHLLVMSCGRIVTQGALEEIKRRSADEVSVTWVQDGERRQRNAGAGYLNLVAELVQGHPAGSELDFLEVRHGSLEESYLRIVAEQAADAAEVVS